ncbi:MAG: hypothetical protein IKL02_00830 [Kiritimatiellae bacterium]|nr:hypothetical protein [Kiritimatiellia bacterium]
MKVPIPSWIELESKTLDEARRCCRNEAQDPDTIGYKIEDDAGNIIEKWGSV